MASKIDPKRIRIDYDTQSRVEMNESVIAEYAEAMQSGVEFPPILVFFDETNNEFILADGFHRYAAHMRTMPNDPILAEQRIGTIDDASWASLAANQSHGLQRTNADKQNAVKRALLHPTGSELSDRQVAKHVGVSHTLVSGIREELEVSGKVCQIETRTVQRGNQKYQQKTKKIGKTKSGSVASCSDCMSYSTSSGTCMYDSEKRTPWTEACDDFEEITEGLRRRELPPPPEEYTVADPKPKKKRKRCTSQNKPRRTVAVDIPMDNPDLAAVELRESLGVDYLKQCFISVRMLLAEDNLNPDES